MKINEDLSIIHGYLCADGYVVKNPKNQKHKYYRIGFRNTNIKLLEDFKRRFERYFNIKIRLIEGQRCEIGSKEIYEKLVKKFGSFYSREWKIPKLSKNLLTKWLRAFFDCEAWVEVQPAKSRCVRVDCSNKEGLESIRLSLRKLGIKSSIRIRKNRDIWRLNICGYNNLKIFQNKIGFLHPNKDIKLKEVLGSYISYYWEIPKDKRNLLIFIKQKGKLNKQRSEIRFFTIKKSNLYKLKKTLINHNIKTEIYGPYINNHGSINYYLSIKLNQGGQNLWILKNSKK